MSFYMMKMRQSKYPLGWDEERVCNVITHYEQQSQDEAVAEDEAAFEYGKGTVDPRNHTKPINTNQH